nr:MAG TPA: Protein of unknown function (DUF2612) [Caudoviricetes sp.]
MANENEYTQLIAGAHREKPRFTEWLYQLTQPLLAARTAIKGFVLDYDIDYATGAQLDAVGVRVGEARKLALKITDVFFAFDDVDGVGFDLGIWQTARDDTYGITELSDEVYRVLLKAKVALNQYGGKNEDLIQLIDLISQAFGLNTSQIAYVDSQDMSVTVYIDKARVPPIVWQLFYNKVIALNHAGVLENIVNGVGGNLAATNGTLLTDDSGNLLFIDITSS